VGEFQQAPGSRDGDAVPRGQARGVAVVSDKKARKPTSRDDCDGLSLAQVLSRWISGAGQLVAKHLDVLVLSRIGVKRLAEDILCRAQCG
jgi:hypothetical protein